MDYPGHNVRLSYFVQCKVVMASLSAGSDANSGFECPPINLIYSHYHNAIRTELTRLSKNANDLENTTTGKLGDRLAALRTQCRFLEKIYKYHSCVEDEVRSNIFLLPLPTPAFLHSNGLDIQAKGGGDSFGKRSRHLQAGHRKQASPTICISRLNSQLNLHCDDRWYILL